MELSLRRYCIANTGYTSQFRKQQKTYSGISKKDVLRREQLLRGSRCRLICQCLQGGATSIRDDLRLLHRALNDAVDREDYCKAARLRDKIISVETSDPVMRIKKQLREAVENEDYFVAAQLRDQLRETNSSSKPPSACIRVDKKLQSISCSSDVLTRDIRIRVRSFYVAHLSAASQGRYVFAYQVEILNEGNETVQLKHRSWKIIDAKGKIKQTSGSGVIGQQPILGPGHYFQYMSICPLETSFGTMEGCYEMAVLNRQAQEIFYANIGKFRLDVNEHKKI
eukprot:g1911.t1